MVLQQIWHLMVIGISRSKGDPSFDLISSVVIMVEQCTHLSGSKYVFSFSQKYDSSRNQDTCHSSDSVKVVSLLVYETKRLSPPSELSVWYIDFQ